MKGLGAVAALIGVLLAVNSHFASAGDVNELRKSLDRSALQTDITIQSVRKAQVFDQLEQMRIKEAARGRLPVHEAQRLNRLATEFSALERDIDAKNQRLNQLQYPRR